MSSTRKELRIGLYNAQNKVAVLDEGNLNIRLAECSIHEAATRIMTQPDMLKALQQILDDPVLDSDTQRLMRAHAVARAAIAGVKTP